MKIRFDILQGWKKKQPQASPQLERAERYNVPDTLGKPKMSDRQKKAMDACFSPVRSMIAHSLEGLSDEGLPQFPGYTLLCGLSQNSLIRSGVEMRAKEMTRKWGEVTREDDENKEDNRVADLGKALEAYKIKDIFRKCAEKNGFLGGCLLFIDTGEEAQELVNPLILDSRTFKKGSLKGFRIIDPYVIYPGIYNAVNPLDKNYYKPSVWYVQGIPVHASRFLFFQENEMPNLLKPAYNFLGLSLTQKVMDAVSHYTRNRESASRLLKKVSLLTLKTDMQDVLTGGGDMDLRNRCQYFVNNWDYDGLAVIDKDTEDIAILNNTLSGVIDIVRQAMEYVAAMFNEPATKMWGISPAGFNATGESDMKNHYDNIASLQSQMFGDNIQKILDILQLDMYGNINEAIGFRFAPLSDEAEQIQATTNKLKAETDEIYMSMGAIGAEEVRNKIITDKNSGYDDLIPYTDVEPTDVPEPPAIGHIGEGEGNANTGEKESIPQNGNR